MKISSVVKELKVLDFFKYIWPKYKYKYIDFKILKYKY